jgi:PhzF family phenazine biosynthesis protein
MNIQRIAAFSQGDSGGNPAGVVVLPELPTPSAMLQTAREVGYSETVFAAPEGAHWRVRYFSPEAEIPFCGHATIALAAALAAAHGDGAFQLQLAHASIRVQGRRIDARRGEASFASPPCTDSAVERTSLAAALDLFGLQPAQLDPGLAPAIICAGARHLLLALRSRDDLRAMRYDFERGQALMREQGWVTVLLAVQQAQDVFDARNAFAYGGVYEDPATGASAAAFAGYLRRLGHPGGRWIEVHQGDDVGVPCRLEAMLPVEPGGAVTVRGSARTMEP